jgi:FkbM family methyltransferase
MDRFQTKRTLLRPVTALRRRRWSARCSPFTRAIYEAQDYRPAIRRFFKASAADPDILVDVDLPEGGVVLDVGAYIGEWSQRILDRADARGVQHLQIHAFEPEPSSIRRFGEAMDQEPRVTLHPVGLGGRDRQERLVVDGQASSVFVNPTTTDLFGSTDVEVRDVDAVLSSLGVDRIDVVKINIEGAEFELLDRLHETGWTARTGTVIVQFHEFAPDAYRGRRRNRRQLAETHRCTWDYPWVYERWDPR